MDCAVQSLVHDTIFWEAAQQAFHSNYTIDAAILTPSVSDGVFILDKMSGCHHGKMRTEQNFGTKAATSTGTFARLTAAATNATCVSLKETIVPHITQCFAPDAVVGAGKANTASNPAATIVAGSRAKPSTPFMREIPTDDVYICATTHDWGCALSKCCIM